MNRPMTFDELCRTFNCTPREREELAWHLGTLRLRKTVQSLAKEPDEAYARSLLDVLRVQPTADAGDHDVREECAQIAERGVCQSPYGVGGLTPEEVEEFRLRQQIARDIRAGTTP